MVIVLLNDMLNDDLIPPRLKKLDLKIVYIKSKEKRKLAKQKDKALLKQRKNSEISSRELLDKYISLTSENSLLCELRHIEYQFK